MNPNTPRTKEACQVLGIEPIELIQKKREDFNKPGVKKEIQDIRYQYHLKQIQRDHKKVLQYKQQHFT